MKQLLNKVSELSKFLFYKRRSKSIRELIYEIHISLFGNWLLLNPDEKTLHKKELCLFWKLCHRNMFNQRLSKVKRNPAPWYLPTSASWNFKWARIFYFCLPFFLLPKWGKEHTQLLAIPKVPFRSCNSSEEINSPLLDKYNKVINQRLK